MHIKLEYQNPDFNLEVEADQKFDIFGRNFTAFAKALDVVNKAEPLSTLTLERGEQEPAKYDYRVETKTGPRLAYVLDFGVSPFVFQFSTEGTFWVPQRVLLNTNLRLATMTLIEANKVYKIEITFS